MAFITESGKTELRKGSVIPIVIRKGSKLQLKHYSLFEPITHIIASIQENKIIMDLPQKLLENNILIGDSLVCIYLDSNVEYVMTGEVVNITLYFPHQITIKIDNVEKYDNKRKHTRFPVSLSANITNLKNNEPYFAVVRNLSIIGASFTCKAEIAVGAEIAIDLAVSQNNIVTYQGIVVRARQLANFYEYGLVQTKIDDSNYREMVKYIKSLEREEENSIAGEEI